MMVMETKAAMSAYSIAVAPVSSDTKRRTVFLKCRSHCSPASGPVERIRDFSKRVRQGVFHCGQRTNDCDGDQSGDKPVLNRSGARLVAPEILDKLRHGVLAQVDVRTRASERWGGLRSG